MKDQLESENLNGNSKPMGAVERDSAGNEVNAGSKPIANLSRITRRSSSQGNNSIDTHSTSNTNENDSIENSSSYSKSTRKTFQSVLGKCLQYCKLPIDYFKSFFNKLQSRVTSIFLHRTEISQPNLNRGFASHRFFFRNYPYSFDTTKSNGLFSVRIKIYGFKRFASEFLSEAMTISIILLLVSISLARSAIMETQHSDWKVSDNLSITFLDRNGQTIGKRGDLTRKFLSDENIPNHLMDAILVSIDRDFLKHTGFTSIESMILGSDNGDELTITQKVVKEMFTLDKNPEYARFTEFFLVLWMEATHTKFEILRHFLDQAYYGSGKYGIVDASEYYFNKDVSGLTLAESAMLVAILDTDRNYELDFHLPNVRYRTNKVLDRMLIDQHISTEQFNYARLHPVEVVHRSNSFVPDYFLDIAYEEVKWRTEESTENTFFVRTTLDMDMQRLATSTVWQSMIESGLIENPPEISLVSMEPDGAVLAMVGKNQYGLDRTNPLTETLHRPGSSIKPLLFASAVDVPTLRKINNGRKLDEYVEWLTNDVSQENSLLDPDHWDTIETLDLVKLTANPEIRINQVLSSLFNLGVVTEHFSAEDYHQISARATVVDMASGYAMLSNGGHRILAYGVLEITDSKGEVFWTRKDYESEDFRILDPENTNLLNQVLVDNTRDNLEPSGQLNDYTLAGKFGYSTRANNSWYIGYSGSLTTAVWCGNVDKVGVEPEASADFITGIWTDFTRQALPTVPPRTLPGTVPTQYEMRNKLDSVVERWSPSSVRDLTDPGLSSNILNIIRRINRKMFEIQYENYN